MYKTITSTTTIANLYLYFVYHSYYVPYYDNYCTQDNTKKSFT